MGHAQLNVIGVVTQSQFRSSYEKHLKNSSLKTTERLESLI
jgi:hypothetical protein